VSLPHTAFYREKQVLLAELEKAKANVKALERQIHRLIHNEEIESDMLCFCDQCAKKHVDI
jgi:cell division protein FtsB